ncbi:MAG: tetratricopeptide repeat protein [Candidatus Heimdallarchaeota archaeon]|nr:tetratricopeptide repeat protein [Candidatus Heimdallarchaeota archaeon]
MDETFSELYQKATESHKEGDLKEAKIYFERAYNMNPSNGMLVYNYANFLADLGRFQQALTKYNEAIEIDDSVPSIFYNKGNCLLDLKRYDEAIHAYDNVLELNPNYSEAQFNKAVVLTALKRLDEAIESYKEILIMDPDFHLVNYNLACLYSKQLNVKLAITNLQVAIDKQDNDVDYKYEAGLDGDFDNIRHLKQFRKLIQ